MTNYVKTTNFSAKDSLPSGDSNKIVKGTEIDTEYDNIATHVETKANKILTPTANNAVKQTGTGDIADAGYQADAIPVTSIDIANGTAETSAADGDLIPIYDLSATANRVMTRANLFGTILDNLMQDLYHAITTVTDNNAGQSLTGSAYTTRTISEVTDEIGVTTSSGNMTFPAGTYYIEAWGTAYATSAYGHIMYLYNNSDSSYTLNGSPCNAAASTSSISKVAGRFTLASSKTLSLRSYMTTTGNACAAINTVNTSYTTTSIRVWKLV